jgi:hypothetical protein
MSTNWTGHAVAYRDTSRRSSSTHFGPIDLQCRVWSLKLCSNVVHSEKEKAFQIRQPTADQRGSHNQDEQTLDDLICSFLRKEVPPTRSALHVLGCRY